MQDPKNPASTRHRPILVESILEHLKVQSGGVYADLTFGEGGHSDAILALKPALLVGQDQDAAALAQYQEKGLNRTNPALVLKNQTILEFAEQPENHNKYDGILADLGVSTFQLLYSGRGFTFQKPEPLDMRMDTSGRESLQSKLENVEEEELANAIYRNTELRESRRIARKLLEAFRAGKLKTTADLAALYPPPKRPGIHPATVLFLGLRMWVNEEYEQVAEGIPLLVDCLKPGGRLAVLTFHSVEDRLVKYAFQRLAGARPYQDTENFYATEARQHAAISLVTRKPIAPSAAELQENPRARSAKLRCIEKKV